MAGYDKKFFQGFGTISKPLTNLLKKGQQFVWKSETQAYFFGLEASIDLCLALPDFSIPFIIETDGSDKGILSYIKVSTLLSLSRQLDQKSGFISL